MQKGEHNGQLGIKDEFVRLGEDSLHACVCVCGMCTVVCQSLGQVACTQSRASRVVCTRCFDEEGN